MDPKINRHYELNNNTWNFKKYIYSVLETYLWKKKQKIGKAVSKNKRVWILKELVMDHYLLG